MKTPTTKRTARRLAASLAIITALATAQSAWAATDTTWNGGSGGTEAAPINFYDSTKWSSEQLPSDAYNLKFSVDAPLVITNTASASTYVADHICFNKGQYTVLGPAKFNGFHEGASESGTVSITKKGDWTTHWYFYPCYTSGSTVVVTNKTGNWIIGGSASDVGMRAPYTASSTFRFVIESGTITLKKTSSIGYKGTGYLELNGGKIQSDSYLNIGSAGTGYMTINGGEFVGASTLKRLAYDTGSKGTLTMNGGKATFSGGDLEIGRKGAGNVIMNGGTLTVNSGKWVYMGRESGSSGNIALNGGTFTAAHIHKGGNGGTITFDGGTLKANASCGDNGGIIQNDTGIKVVVAANGGTIDTGGYNVTYGKNTTTKSGVANDGGLKFQGGGSVTVTGDANNPRLTYNGRTTVAVGTTLKVPTATIGGGFAATIPSGLAEDIYTVVEITGSAVFPDDVLANSELPSDPKARFFLSSDKKAICCAYVDLTDKSVWTGAKDSNLLDGDNWLGDVPTAENGRLAVIGVVANTTLQCNGTFSPKSITFAADSKAITFNGTGSITGIEAITNLNASSTETNHRFNIPVSGNTVDLNNRGVSCCIFSGGFTVAKPVLSNSADIDNAHSLAGRWTITGASWSPSAHDTVRGSASITFEHELKNPGNFNIASGAVVTAATMKVTSSTHPAYSNSGRVVVNGICDVSNTSADFSLAREDSQNATVILGGLVFNTSKWPWLNAKTTVIGADGIKFDSSHDNLLRFSGSTQLYARDETLTLHAGKDDNQRYAINKGKTLTINTTQFESSPAKPSTVYVNGKIVYYSSNDYNGGMAVKGIGKVVFNSVSTFSGGLTVGDTATVAINAGKQAGTGAMTVNSGATLEIPQSGTVTLGGSLTLNSGAKLKFNFTEKRTAPKLNVSNKTVTATGTYKVAVSAAEGVRPVGGDYVLTSGGKFGSATVSLDDDAPFWAAGVSKNADNDIVLSVSSVGLMFFVK